MQVRRGDRRANDGFVVGIWGDDNVNPVPHGLLVIVTAVTHMGQGCDRGAGMRGRDAVIWGAVAFTEAISQTARTLLSVLWPDRDTTFRDDTVMDCHYLR